MPRIDRRATAKARSDTPVVLEVQNLNKTYRRHGGFFSKGRIVHAVNDVSFSIRKGRTLGIVGESGSGKSSLGRVLLKLLDSDGGSILFDGTRYRRAVGQRVPARAATASR